MKIIEIERHWMGKIDKLKMETVNPVIADFFEKVDENTPAEMIKSDKFERGDRVNWLDRDSGKLMSGTLWVRNKCVWESNAEDPYDEGHPTDYWVWTIYGDDDHAYGFREEYLIKE